MGHAAQKAPGDKTPKRHGNYSEGERMFSIWVLMYIYGCSKTTRMSNQHDSNLEEIELGRTHSGMRTLIHHILDGAARAAAQCHLE